MQGDALFFHCNLLHCSSANMSTARRWAFLCAYNRADNDPVIKHHHPNYTPLQKVSCYTYVIRRKTKHCFAPIALKMVWFKNTYSVSILVFTVQSVQSHLVYVVRETSGMRFHKKITNFGYAMKE